MTRLQFNPDPLRVVEVRRGESRGADGWLCDHVDGRGRCTNRNTKPYMVGLGNIPAWYCERHAPGDAASPEPSEEGA